MEAAVGAVFNPGVMSGRDEIRLERMRAAPQTIELDFAIAHHARIRRSSAEIFGDEIIYDAGGEVGTQIDHVKWKIHPLRDSARVLEILVRAAGAAALRDRRRWLGRETHRDPDDVVAILPQHRRGDAAVDPARHRDQNSRAHRDAPSATGSAAATRRHTSGMMVATASISFAVVFQPRLIRSELRASARLRPIASSTCDGSTAPAAHAEPIETSTSARSSAINMLSPSTFGNVRFSVFGIRPVSGPLSLSPGMASRKRARSVAASISIRDDSTGIERMSASADAPNAIAPSRFGVPARRPASCG